VPEAERTPEQVQLLHDVTHMKSYISEHGITNAAVNQLADNAEERLATLNDKRPNVTRTDLRNVLRHEIAAFDGCQLLANVKEGQDVVLDSSGRPDIRLGIYDLLKQNGLFEDCSFSSYNMEAPSEEELGRTASRRLVSPKHGGNLYDSHDIEENYTSLFPAPIYIPKDTALEKTDMSIIRACQSAETALFKQGDLTSYFVKRGVQATNGHMDYDIIRINPEDRMAAREQHNLVTNSTPPTLLKPSLIKSAEHAQRLGEGKF